MNWIAQSLGIVTSNVTLPGWIVLAGAVLGAIFVFLLLVRSEPNENPLTLLVLIGILLGGMGVGTAIVREVKQSHTSTELRDLETRATAIETALAQAGLGCLNADEPLQASCEVALFERPENVAAARGLTRARLELVEDAFAFVNRRKAPYLLERVAVWRRPLERDPYGLVASVMLEQRNCTPTSCPELAVIGDVSHITANMKDDRYGALVAKYQVLWERVARNRGAFSSPGRTGPFGFPIVEHAGQPAAGDGAGAAPEAMPPPVNLPVENAGPAAQPPASPAQEPAQTVPQRRAPLPPQRPDANAPRRTQPRPQTPRTPPAPAEAAPAPAEPAAAPTAEPASGQ